MTLPGALQDGGHAARVLLLVLIGAASVIDDCDNFQPTAVPLLWPALSSTPEVAKRMLMSRRRKTMLWRLQLLALLGFASAGGDSVYHDGSLQAAVNSLLWPAVASNPDMAKHIVDVEKALGMCNLTKPTQLSNPEPLQQGPVVQVPEMLPAPWHAIAEPPNAVCAVRSPLVWLLSRMYFSALCGTSSSLRLQNTPFVQPFAHADAHHARSGCCSL